MIDWPIFWLCIIVSILGLAAIAGIMWLGRYLFHAQFGKTIFAHPFFDGLLHRWMRDGPDHDDVAQFISEGYSDYLQRRNEFWTSYGQVLLAILIVIVLSILLLTKAISAEAGLPILSGISGFAIAKGVSGAKTFSLPREKKRRE